MGTSDTRTSREGREALLAVFQEHGTLTTAQAGFFADFHRHCNPALAYRTGEELWRALWELRRDNLIVQDGFSAGGAERYRLA